VVKDGQSARQTDHIHMMFAALYFIGKVRSEQCPQLVLARTVGKMIHILLSK
jgi:hypothetical protein